MKVSQIETLMEITDLSAEELGKRIGISGMTIRRWMKGPKTKELSEFYTAAVQDGCYRMIREGMLDPESGTVRELLSHQHPLHFQAALHYLGLPEGLNTPSEERPEEWMAGLAKIGMKQERQDRVNSEETKVLSFKEFGSEWSEKIGVLWNAIRSIQLSSLDKYMAYGALFYLITPFDLIPDNIPIFGLLDDFGVISIAAAYYRKKFSAQL